MPAPLVLILRARYPAACKCWADTGSPIPAGLFFAGVLNAGGQPAPAGSLGGSASPYEG